MEIIAKELLKKEIIFQQDLVDSIGPRPFEQATHYQEFTTSTGQYQVKKVDREEATSEEPLASNQMSSQSEPVSNEE